MDDVHTDINKGSLLSAMLLVAGCCIGGGMLALPIATGTMGFVPSLIVMLLAWVAMTATGLLLVEASLWFEEGAHMVTMATRLLGPFVRYIAWGLYLYICYASLVAYTSAGGDMIRLVVLEGLQWDLSKFYGCLAFTAIFGPVLYLGNHVVGRVNSILFFGMIIAYALLTFVGIPEVNLSRLQYQQWQGATLAMPLLLTSFSFQTVVPSLTPYLSRNVVHLRVAIVGGTSIAFIVYAIWQFMILGMVPVESLTEAQLQGEPATHILYRIAQSSYVQSVATFFAFFALVTSFLAIAMGLIDFLSDASKLTRKGWAETILSLAVLVPTLLVASGFERAFLVALDTSGGIGDSILNGVIPTVMIWCGRYRMGYKGTEGVRGGKIVLTFLGLFYLFVALQEVMVLSGILDWLGSAIRTVDY